MSEPIEGNVSCSKCGCHYKQDAGCPNCGGDGIITTKCPIHPISVRAVRADMVCYKCIQDEQKARDK